MTKRRDLIQNPLLMDEPQEVCWTGWHSLWSGVIDYLWGDELGIYVIREGGRILYVGQGIVRNRLHDHRKRDSKVMRASKTGSPVAAWALVPKRRHRNGAERHLARVLMPVVGIEWPGGLDVPVNLPDGLPLSFGAEQLQLLSASTVIRSTG